MGILQSIFPTNNIYTTNTIMNSKIIFNKIANIIKKRMSKKITKKVVMYNIDLHAEEEDNSANEALEAELMALLASANPHPEQETVTILVPASPDHIKREFTITTGSQSAQPQTA